MYRNLKNVWKKIKTTKVRSRIWNIENKQRDGKTKRQVRKKNGRKVEFFPA